ncbi:MAG TPA: hypothetical protein VEX15_18350 [Nocardioidaceae bacterium]|nr:hypothetical protein [Nocardioidaceae bacterium]
MDVAALTVSIFAVCLSGVSLWVAIVRTKAAVRAADAAEEATGYKRTEVERNRVRFELEPLSSQDQHALWNKGTDSAYGVYVDVGRFGGDVSYDEFPSGHPERLHLSPLFGQEDRHITVTWYHTPDCSDVKRERKILVDWQPPAERQQ